MVLKKEILGDLKRFNKELEKHIGGVDFSFISKDPKFFNENKNEEFLSLFATNISDLRTEFALFRRNFSLELESIVMKSILNQQSEFISQINQFHSTIIEDLKANFSQHIIELNESVLSIKKDFLKIQNQNDFFNSSISNFNSNLADFKSLLNKIDLKVENRNFEKILDEKLEEFENKIDLKVENRNFEKILDEKLEEFENKFNMIFNNHNLILKNIINLNQKIINIENSKNYKDSNLGNNNIYENILKKNKNDNNNEIENKKNNFKKEIKTEIISKPKSSISNFDSTNIDKILEIDRRLKNINSLR